MDLMFSVCVITYNQEKYIAQTLDSIISQEHNYSYEIVVGDDCSTDGTRNIISKYVEKYPDIIKPIYNEKNLGLIRNYFNTIKHCSGKYIMECAGDDWWLPGKVAEQIDFMEKNEDVGMCYGKAKVWNEAKTCFDKKSIGAETISTVALLEQNKVPAVTVCFKNDLIKRYIAEIQPEKKDWKMEDYPFWIYISNESRIKFNDLDIAVYRLLENSESHSTDIQKELSFEKSRVQIINFFCKKYSFNLIEIDDESLLAEIYLRKLINKYDKGTGKKFRHHFYKSMQKIKRYILSHLSN